MALPVQVLGPSSRVAVCYDLTLWVSASNIAGEILDSLREETFLLFIFALEQAAI